MAPFRSSGPLCQTQNCLQGLDAGTLPRTTMPSAAPLGTGPAASPPQRARRVVAKGKCAFLNPQAQGTVLAPKEAFDRLRQSSDPAKISTAQEIASQTWPDNSSSAATSEDVVIGNQTITVIRPKDNEASGKNLPSTKQVAEALRAIPADQRVFTKTVIVSPKPHPKSTPNRTIAGEASRGEIDLYPVPNQQEQVHFDNRLMHESGHNYQEKLWGSTAAVSEWQAAADADGLRPSPYAAAGTGEDFCEFNILYNTAKGTPCEETAKQIYANRWTKRESY
jgi:hypothetical protein